VKNTKNMHPTVFSALHTNSKEELGELYQSWARRYDADVLNKIGYIGHIVSTELLLRHLPETDARILDAGCGTGLVGEILKCKGFDDVVGIDFSPSMLDQAAEKGVYRSLELADLTQDFAFDDNAFDAIICAGTFTCGHIGPDALIEMVRVCKIGGYISFTVREHEWDGAPYAEIIAKLKQDGRWRCVEQIYTDYNLNEGVSCRLCLFQVC